MGLSAESERSRPGLRAENLQTVPVRTGGTEIGETLQRCSLRGQLGPEILNVQPAGSVWSQIFSSFAWPPSRGLRGEESGQGQGWGLVRWLRLKKEAKD